MLWGLWLFVLGAFFSAGGYPNSYYVAALSPAIGALCGTGVAVAWQRRRGARGAGVSGGRLWLSRSPTACICWTGDRVYRDGSFRWPCSRASSACWGCAVVHRGDRDDIPAGGVVALAIACALLLPGVASALMVIRGLGPFAAPYEPSSATISRAGKPSERGSWTNRSSRNSPPRTAHRYRWPPIPRSWRRRTSSRRAGRSCRSAGFRAGYPRRRWPSCSKTSTPVRFVRCLCHERATTHGLCGSVTTAPRRNSPVGRPRCMTAAGVEGLP